MSIDDNKLVINFSNGLTGKTFLKGRKFAAKKLVMAGFELPDVLIPLIADDEV